MTRPLGLVGKRRNRGAKLLLQQRNPSPQIQTEIDRYLLIPRTPGMKTTAGVANAGDQLALNETVDVLVIAADPRRLLAPALKNRVESIRDGCCVVGVEHTSARERFGPGQAACHVVFEQAAIEWKRDAEIECRWIGRRIKSSRP